MDLFFRLYAANTKGDILKNRNTIATGWVYLARVVHGTDKKGWTGALKEWLGQRSS